MRRMFFNTRDPVYEARSVNPDDADSVQRLVERAWRVYLRISLDKLQSNLRPGRAWIAGRADNVKGFMLAEIQPSRFALITAAALSDDWQVSSYLDTFLPVVERTVHPKGVTALAQIGYAPWLTEVLRERGFVCRDWVVTYEWQYQPITVRGNSSVTIRSAHVRDLPTLVSLDESIFGPIWHKPTRNFEEALARAFVFFVAEQDGHIVGYQWCEKHERHGHITRLAVRSGWEGLGVGTRLVTEALLAMVNAGVTWVTLNTQESNLRSRMLYERHSFRLLDDRVAVLWKDL